jgi:hypothetical protein
MGRTPDIKQEGFDNLGAAQVERRRAKPGGSKPAARNRPLSTGNDDRTSDSERIGNTQLVVNDLPVLQVL